MPKLRHAVLILGAAVWMSAGDAAATVDTSDEVRALATDAAALIAEELALVTITDPGTVDSPSRLAEAGLQLAEIDAEGFALLQRFDQLNVDLTAAIRSAMQRLPDGSADASELRPEEVVYRAAIGDLLRIASTPEAVISEGPTTGGRDSVGLIIVAAIALLVLGAVALNTTLRHEPKDLAAADLAWRDSLTGLANRRRLDQDLNTILTTDPRLERLAAVIMVDIDHFKSVNDEHGHAAGDELLRQVSTVLTQQVRVDDVVYRYGGEEFCIILPGADQHSARKVADRIVTASRELAGAGGVRVTVSAGVAEGPGSQIDRTMAAADQALFVAKRHGRDQVADAGEVADGQDSRLTA
ncbi:MAG TPA: GGDEF domain-containing protein [Ilumatobacter sp.]|nr:GGDEF domain-containing protein [Ilumatobacter sp.]